MLLYHESSNNSFGLEIIRNDQSGNCLRYKVHFCNKYWKKNAINVPLTKLLITDNLVLYMKQYDVTLSHLIR